MSNTRHQSPEERQFRQDAFASSPEYERGVLGNLVASRCQKLSDPEEIAMLWWLQQISWRDGGLERFAAEFFEANHASIGTRSMFQYGMKEGQIYTRAQVRKVRAEMDDREARHFPLRGEIDDDDAALDLFASDDPARQIEARARAANYPTSYPATAFVEACERHLEDMRLEEILKRALVDPQSESLRKGLWNFPGLWDALCAWRQREINLIRERIVETSVTRQVYEELDFARETRSFVLIEGREGIGKSEAARAWCTQHPGQAVYVSLESGNDEVTLFRSIGRKIGTACSLGRKATEIKARIEEALQPGHLMLVIDEGHFIFPQTERAERSAPKRIDWLRTALIDFGVPIALISTPQRFARSCERFRKAGWNSNQIQRRVARTALLPRELTKKDMVAIAKHYFPLAPAQDALLIAGAAALTIGFLGTIANLRKRVNFLTSRRPGVSETALLALALGEIIAKPPAAENATGTSLPAARKPIAKPVLGTCRSSAIPTFPAPGVQANRLANLVQQPGFSAV